MTTEKRPDDWGDEMSWQDLETVNRLDAEYRHHMAHRSGNSVRKRPIEELTQEYSGKL